MSAPSRRARRTCRWCSRPVRCSCRWRKKGLIDGPIAELVAHRYLDPLLATVPRPQCAGAGLHAFSGAEGRRSREVAGPDIALVDSAETTRASAVEAIARASANLAARRAGAHPRDIFLATDAPERFARVGEIFLGAADRSGERVELALDRLRCMVIRELSVIHPHQIEPVRRRDRAAAARSFAASASATSRGCHLPSPTSFSVPTIERT